MLLLAPFSYTKLSVYVNPLARWYILIVVLGWGSGSAPCELQQFWLFLKKCKVRTHRWMQNWILWHIKKFFNVLSFFGRVWLISLQKVLIWPPKIFSKYFQYIYKKMQNLMPISNRWKSIKKDYTEKVRGLRRTFVYSTKIWIST